MQRANKPTGYMYTWSAIAIARSDFNVVYCGSQCWVLSLPLATCECWPHTLSPSRSLPLTCDQPSVLVCVCLCVSCPSAEVSAWMYLMFILLASCTFRPLRINTFTSATCEQHLASLPCVCLCVCERVCVCVFSE